MPEHVASEADEHGEQDQQQSKKKLTMSYEEYKSLTNMLVLYMRSEEERYEIQGTCSHKYYNIYKYAIS